MIHPVQGAIIGTLLIGAVNYQDVSNYIFQPDHSIPDTLVHTGTNSEGAMEAAAENFDNFAIQTPGVLYKRAKAVMKYGSKAIFEPAVENVAAEKNMISSLTKGLKNVATAIEVDAYVANTDRASTFHR
ncbi:hypothetical protein [Methylomonas sp. AM2-LC]|uniref:hypothetical protein n=1 Tax=Methylomonas sp. AM2-LC TaxID=3153301 RepID=UPI0032678ED5